MRHRVGGGILINRRISGGARRSGGACAAQSNFCEHYDAGRWRGMSEAMALGGGARGRLALGETVVKSTATSASCVQQRVMCPSKRNADAFNAREVTEGGFGRHCAVRRYFVGGMA